jgi:CRP-like cAMP-binding protein
MNALEAYFVTIGFSRQECCQISACFRSKNIAKGEYFVREGAMALQVAFVEEGALQYYSINQEGEEQSTYVSLSGSFAASLLSYLSEVPARENIRAITKSKLWLIGKQEMQGLQAALPAFKDFYIQLLEGQICCIDKARFDLITLNAEKRYKKILQEEPRLLQEVPLKYVASLLGITQRHLSRLRKSIR